MPYKSIGRRRRAEIGAAGWAVAELVRHPTVESANQIAYSNYLAAQPALVGIGVAGAQVPGLRERMILHAGPPISWNEMCGAMQGAIIGAILYEGWAADATVARRLADSGAVAFEPAHHHAAVGPWPALSARRCRCGSSRMREAVTARIAI